MVHVDGTLMTRGRPARTLRRGDRPRLPAAVRARAGRRPDGNVSVRLVDGDDPRHPEPGCRRWMLPPDDLVVVESRRAKCSQGRRPPSSEIADASAHLRNGAPTSRAVVHAHPPTATGFARGRRRVHGAGAARSYLADGSGPACAVRHTGNATRSPIVSSRCSTDHDAFLLANHGATTLGPTLEVAHQRMESLEHAARITARRALARKSERVERRATCVALRPSGEDRRMTDSNRSLSEVAGADRRATAIRELARRARRAARDDAGARLRARAGRLSDASAARRRAARAASPRRSTKSGRASSRARSLLEAEEQHASRRARRARAARARRRAGRRRGGGGVQARRRLDRSDSSARRTGSQTRIDELEALLDQRYTPPAPRASGEDGQRRRSGAAEAADAGRAPQAPPAPSRRAAAPAPAAGTERRWPTEPAPASPRPRRHQLADAGSR